MNEKQWHKFWKKNPSVATYFSAQNKEENTARLEFNEAVRNEKLNRNDIALITISSFVACLVAIPNYPDNTLISGVAVAIGLLYSSLPFMSKKDRVKTKLLNASNQYVHELNIANNALENKMPAPKPF